MAQFSQGLGFYLPNTLPCHIKLLADFLKGVVGGHVDAETHAQHFGFTRGEAGEYFVGGFTQAMTGDMSEIVGFLQSGEVRALAVLTEERVPGFDDIPTAVEQGFDVVAVNWRGLYVPKNISDDDFNAWGDKLAAVAESEEWKAAMTANGLAPFTKVGGDFQSWVDGVITSTEELSREIGVIK